MALDAEDLRRFAEVTQRVDSIVRAMPAAVRGNSSAHISVNAGGLGLWLATTACLVMLAMNVVLVMLFVDHGRQIDDLNDKLTATYMMAPHLKPPPETQK